MGTAWVQPSVGELVKNVAMAAFDLNPRMLIDPRAGLRYTTNLTSRLVKLQGGLFLSAVLTTDPTEVPERHERSRWLRSIA